MTNSPSPTDTVASGRRWTTTTSRLMLVYSITFLCSMLFLLGFIECVVTAQMEHEVDVVMRWELIYFDSTSDSQLPDSIRDRQERQHMHANYYGLFTADGKHVAGDVLVLPPQLTLDGNGVSLTQTLSIEGGQRVPVARAMAQRRKDGNILLVSREITNIHRVRQAIVDAFVGGGLFCLAAGLAVGLAMSVWQLRRVRAIRRVTLQIAQGDLGQRLAIGGRDEIDLLSQVVNHMLDEVERLMGEVKGACDGIAHDLRTPLAHVVSLLGTIAQRADTLNDPPLLGLVARARSDTDRVLERFRAILRISEIGTMKRRGGFAEMQLQTLVQEVGELYEPLAESRSIQFAMRVEPVPVIHGDRDLLFEALSNLLDNAIKFTPPGGMVTMDVRPTPAGAQVSIADTGPGIAPAEREAVLRRFYRSERTRHVAGSGIGLSIVSAVLGVHDFAIRIDNADPGVRVTIDCWSRTLA